MVRQKLLQLNYEVDIRVSLQKSIDDIESNNLQIWRNCEPM